MRIPISRCRCTTASETTPYSPMHEMSRTTVTDPLITAAAVRGPSLCAAEYWASVIHDSIGVVGSSARIARRIGIISSSAGLDVRTTYRNDDHQLRAGRYSTG